MFFNTSNGIELEQTSFDGLLNSDWSTSFMLHSDWLLNARPMFEARLP